MEMDEETKKEEKREKQGVLKEPNKVFALQAAFFLSDVFINSPPSSPVQSYPAPTRHLGLYAGMSQLAFEELTVGGLSLSIQARLLSGKNANFMLGARENASS